MYFLSENRFILKQSGPAQRGYVLITGGGELKIKADGKIPWVLNLAQAAAGAFNFATSLL